MRFEDGKVAGVGAEARFKLVTSGFLLLEDDTTLVLQCRHQPQPETIQRALKLYFAGYFHLSLPWTDIVIRPLSERERGDREEAEGNSEQIPGVSGPLQTAADVRVMDERSDDETAAPFGDTVQVEDTPAGPAAAVDPASARQVARLAREFGRLTRNGDDAALQEAVETLLQRLPPERALLAVITDPNSAKAADMSVEPVPDALTADDAGIATVTDALVASVMRTAREAGVIGAGEVADRGHIEAMVRSVWTGAPGASALGMLGTLMPLLGSILGTDDARRIRGLLGLKASTVRDVPWLDAFRLWQAACEQVAGQIERLRSVLMVDSDPDLQTIANDDLAGLIDRIAEPVQTAIDGLARGTAEPASVRRRILQIAGYLERAREVRACDTNPFGVEVAIRGILSSALVQLGERVRVR